MVKRTINFELRTTSSTPREREYIESHLEKFSPERIEIAKVLDAKTGEGTGFRFNVVFPEGAFQQSLEAWQEVHDLSSSAIFYGRISIRGASEVTTLREESTSLLVHH